MREIRTAVPHGKELIAHAFPPPFSLASGMDFTAASRHTDGLAVKLYTMHWPMMLFFYAEQLMKANPGVSERLLVQAVASWMDFANQANRDRLSDPLMNQKPSTPIPLFASSLDDAQFQTLRDCRYPEPEEPHPASAGAQARKIAFARERATTKPVYALAHGYGPVEDFRQRLEIAWRASGGRVLINRYGYLSDAKLDAIGAVVAAAP